MTQVLFPICRPAVRTFDFLFQTNDLYSDTLYIYHHVYHLYESRSCTQHIIIIYNLTYSVYRSARFERVRIEPGIKSLSNTIY